MSPLFESPAGSRESPPIGALGKEFVKLVERPTAISIPIAFAVGLVGPVVVLLAVEGGLPSRESAVPWLWMAAVVCIASLFVACAIAAFLPSLILGSRDRAAFVVHAWVGAREVRRLLGSTTAAIGLPHSPEGATEWLRNNPDTPGLRPLRFELLLMERRFDEARALLDHYPRLTAMDQFRVAEAEALVTDQQTGEADESALQLAANVVPPGPDRAEALADVAVFRARRRIGRGDWRAPLVEARPHIPGSDLQILVRDTGWPIFSYIWPRVVFPIGGFIVLVAATVTAMSLA